MSEGSEKPKYGEAPAFTRMKEEEARLAAKRKTESKEAPEIRLPKVDISTSVSEVNKQLEKARRANAENRERLGLPTSIDISASAEETSAQAADLRKSAENATAQAQEALRKLDQLEDHPDKEPDSPEETT